ncbi:peptidase M16 [Rickettsiales bacterium]|nr:peptidase M16 [Rickettsiales bacterium]
MNMLARLLLIFLLAILSKTACLAADNKTGIYNFQETNSSYGFRALLLEDHSSSIVSMAVTFKNAGYAYDPAEKQGLAAMAAALMKEGAGGRNAAEFAEIIESNGIELDFDVDIDDLNITLKTLTKNIDIAIELIRDALTKPLFEPSCIERVKNRFAVLHSNQDSDPVSLGARKFMETAFGDHAYSQSKLGNAATIKNINASDLSQYVKKAINRVNIVISAVGDISKSKLANLLDEYLIDLPLVSANPKLIIDVDPLERVNPVHVEKDFAQSVIFFGQKGISPASPKYYTALIVNYIIGGAGFQSILFDELREKRGLIYTIRTEFQSYAHTNFWYGRTATINPSGVIELIRESIATLKRDGISEAQLEAAKSNIISNFMLNLDTNSKIAAILQRMQILNLGKDYITKLAERINAVSTSEVLSVIQETLEPTNFIFVSVGK